MALTFVHAADLHLDSPQRSLSAGEPLATLLRESTFKALKSLVDLCIHKRADFLLLAGDLYDSQDRSVKARLRLSAELQRLDRAGVRTFIVHGNHDPLTAGAGALELPASVKVFGPQWEEVAIRTGDAILCRVQGLSYPQEKMTADLSAHFHRVGPEPTIGLLHCNVSQHVGHANYSPCTPGDLADRGLDYWALGHVHSHQEIPLPGGGIAVYPGNLQGRHPKEAGPRGCVVVEWEEQVMRRTFVPLDAVRWHEIAVQIDGVVAVDALLDRAEKIALDACAQASDAEGRTFDAHAVRVVLCGAGPLHREVLESEALAELERQLRERLATSSPKVALEWLVERTRPALDERSIRLRGGLSAEVLDEAQDFSWPSELKALEHKLQRLGAGGLGLAADALSQRARERALALLEEESQG